MLKEKIPWNRMLAEGFVIVASILLALAADAWLEERNRQNDEQQLLLSLESELLQVKEGLEELITLLQGDIQRMFRFADTMENAVVGVTPREEINAAASNYGPNATDYSVPRAVLNSMLNGGQISLLDSDRLKIAIADYEQGISRFDETKDRVNDLWLNFLAPYRYQYGSMPTEYGGIGAANITARNVADDIVLEAFAGNSYYKNLLRARGIRDRDLWLSAEALLGKIDVMLELIAGEIE